MRVQNILASSKNQSAGGRTQLFKVVVKVGFRHGRPIVRVPKAMVSGVDMKLRRGTCNGRESYV